MKSYRKGWIAFSILLLLIGCQHQPAEIGLTTVSADYQKQHAENQKSPEFAEQNPEVIAALVNDVVKLRFQRAGEGLASHLTEACRERFITANQAVSGTDYGLTRLGKLESCEILTISDNTALAQIKASYGDTPAAYALVLTLVNEDQTWLVDQSLWMADDQTRRGPVESADQLVKAYQEAVLSQDYARLAALYNVPADPNGLLFWSTVKIADCEITARQIQREQACFQLQFTVEDPGMSQLKKGTSTGWLWCRRQPHHDGDSISGWIIEGLMTKQPPTSWWQS